MHVFRMAKFMAVQIKIRHRIDPVEDQKHVLTGKLLLAYDKVSPDVKIIAEKLPHFIFIFSIIRIRQNAFFYQCIHSGTRNSHRIPILCTGYSYFK